MPEHTFPSVPAPIAVTVVVVANGGRNSEPYLGRPPADDGCYIFGQHPLESAFVLDLRLRDRLSALLDEGHRITQAVLLWDSLESERDIHRRAQLVARRLGPGGKLTLSTKQPDTHTDERFRAFAERLAKDLRWLGVELVVFTSDKESGAPAPLTAAWNRLQRFRGFGTFEAENEALESPNSRTVRTSQTRAIEPEAEVREDLRRSAVFARKPQQEPVLRARQVRR